MIFRTVLKTSTSLTGIWMIPPSQSNVLLIKYSHIWVGDTTISINQFISNAFLQRVITDAYSCFPVDICLEEDLQNALTEDTLLLVYCVINKTPGCMRFFYHAEVYFAQAAVIKSEPPWWACSGLLSHMLLPQKMRWHSAQESWRSTSCCKHWRTCYFRKKKKMSPLISLIFSFTDVSPICCLNKHCGLY